MTALLFQVCCCVCLLFRLLYSLLVEMHAALLYLFMCHENQGMLIPRNKFTEILYHEEKHKAERSKALGKKGDKKQPF